MSFYHPCELSRFDRYITSSDITRVNALVKGYSIFYSPLVLYTRARDARGIHNGRLAVLSAEDSALEAPRHSAMCVDGRARGDTGAACTTRHLGALPKSAHRPEPIRTHLASSRPCTRHARRLSSRRSRGSTPDNTPPQPPPHPAPHDFRFEFATCQNRVVDWSRGSCNNSTRTRNRKGTGCTSMSCRWSLHIVFSPFIHALYSLVRE